MQWFLMPLIAVLALTNAVNANLEPEVHKICLPTADVLSYWNNNF